MFTPPFLPTEESTVITVPETEIFVRLWLTESVKKN